MVLSTMHRAVHRRRPTRDEPDARPRPPSRRPARRCRPASRRAPCATTRWPWRCRPGGASTTCAAASHRATPWCWAHPTVAGPALHGHPAARRVRPGHRPAVLRVRLAVAGRRGPAGHAAQRAVRAARAPARAPTGLPVTVLAFPTIDVIIVATAADDGDALSLIDAVVTTTRAATARRLTEVPCSARCSWPTVARSRSGPSAPRTSSAPARSRCSRTRTATPSTGSRPTRRT